MRAPGTQVALLREGKAEAWNAWRYSELGVRPVLEGIDLSNRGLRSLALWRCRVQNCRFDGADLRDADLRECDCAETSFVAANLTHAACWQSRFHGCDMREAAVEGANFEECRFAGSALSERLDQAVEGRDWHGLPPWYAKEHPVPPDPPGEQTVVTLLGDCTVSCGYLPPSQRPAAVLARQLAESEPPVPAFVYDLSRDGDSAGTLLARYGRDVLPLPRMNIALVRYGITDRKDYGAERFVQLLGELASRLACDFPGVRVVIETGMYVDFPDHYPFDRNAKLAPLYDTAKRFAAERDHALVDIFAELARRTAVGEWDWRIRGLGIGRPTSVHDSSQDHLHKGDRDWFFNIHPNTRCIQLIAELEHRAIAAMVML